MAKFVVYEKVAEAVYRTFPKKDMSEGAQTAVNLGSGLIAGFAAAILSQVRIDTSILFSLSSSPALRVLTALRSSPQTPSSPRSTRVTVRQARCPTA